MLEIVRLRYWMFTLSLFGLMMIAGHCTGEMICYHYTDDELKEKNNGVPEESVCERYGRIFTGGRNTNYPSCFTCSCCQPIGNWECYIYTASERYEFMLSLMTTEKSVCSRDTKVYTGGQNTNYPGCSTCHCCKTVEITTGYTTEQTTVHTTEHTTQYTTEQTTRYELTTLVDFILQATSPQIGCSCPCNAVSNMTYTAQELLNKIEALKRELQINLKNTTMKRALKISADDPRPSSTYLGVFGCIIILVPVVLIVSCDLLNVFRS